ncbi:acyltransferase family protein [Paracraurococcus lichenis]|uniref:Acyltransferase n=1 Tax=Paracraurococcus lichenis TaxID=3064888 RepID=A0ABT9ECB7_9PROT|nr:acyltransferase [Paracraurococcus sp. LOR1-02]MDO9713535.1 acyltransferase [Paracraurococcus sp. LOR1-02]
MAMTQARRGLLPGLHGLRATAAGMVVLFHLHAIPTLPVPEHLPWIATHFGLGVHLFFALSAFSLAWANPEAATRPGPYLVKRFFRIAPLYWLLLAVMLLRGRWPGAGRVAAEALFAFNAIPGWHGSLVPAGWTIGVEMPFYLMLPLLLRIRGVAGMALAAALATLLSWQARLGLEAAMPPDSDYPQVALASNLWVFVLALLAYRVFERVRGTAREGVTAAAAAALALGLLLFLGSPLAVPLAMPGNPDLLLFGLAFAALCLWQALRPSRLLRSGPALWLGERSYSIYLSHFLLILALRPAYARIEAALGEGGWAFLACFAVTLPPLCLAAALGYRWVERPGIALGRRIIARMGARAATPDIVPAR